MERAEINQVLAEMGEPPIGAGDVIQNLADQVAPGDDNSEKKILRLQPDGHPRASLVFINGRMLIVDMQYDELLAEVRDFNEHPEQDFLRLDTIDVVDGKPPVIVSNPISLSRRAIETLQSVGRYWTKHLPGGSFLQEPSAEEQAVAQLRANAQASKQFQVMGGNRQQRRHPRG